MHLVFGESTLFVVEKVLFHFKDKNFTYCVQLFFYCLVDAVSLKILEND